MTRYEQILDKIAPVFYKFLTYNRYFEESYYDDITGRYFKHAKLKDNYFYVDYAFSKYIHYFFVFSKFYPVKGSLESYMAARLSTKYGGVLYSAQYDLDTFITNLVINKFSFENEYVTPKDGSILKKLFIYLVGEDMYETIRSNIK